jgi:hypothetical protein
MLAAMHAITLTASYSFSETSCRTCKKMHLWQYERVCVFNKMERHPILSEEKVYLEHRFFGIWISNCGPKHWPSPSPDLNTLHYFTCGGDE